MKHARLTKTEVLMLLLCWCFSPVAAEDAQLLWQIGKADNNTAEFALGPDRSIQYSSSFPHDVLFVAGQSNPKQDWSYIQPGPADVWAGSKSHTFTIVFALEATSGEGECRLVLDLVDTHSSFPPKLQIDINGESFTRQLPRGGGDDSAFGQPDKGVEHVLTVGFPARALEVGNNHVTITSLTGSWILYDQVMLTGPASARKGTPEADSKLLSVYGQPFLVRRDDGRLYQPILASVLHIGAPAEAEIAVAGAAPARQPLGSGFKVIEGFAPAVESPTATQVGVKVAGKSIGRKELTLKPVRKWEVYLLHHSHVDIGYTHVQTEVEQKHWQYFKEVIELARKTADHPAAAPFKWNTEVLWAVDSYLKQASEEDSEAFVNAVRKGWIGLDALYGNELTALCRPEELIRLVDYARKLRQRYGLTIDTAMITDVPGYTWGIVPVLAQSGVKYFSVGPNRGHRIGYTLSTWGDKPFWWESPCGKYKVLCWVAGEGYSFFHSGRLDGGRLFGYLQRLQGAEYPYDMIQLRYSIGGDNGPPDPKLSDFVRDWNKKYAYPKLVVATTTEMFHEFEKRYGDKIPTFRGDFTPYWEDGAGSSARETTLNRNAAERLGQAETLWAMLDPADYPAGEFDDVWRDVILYDEHTWGAHCSISQPESDFTKAQWKIKQAFALDADAKSRSLLEAPLAQSRTEAGTVANVDVYNTCSWIRTDLVALPKEMKVTGDVVSEADGRRVRSQRLTTGELVFLARGVEPFSAKRFTLGSGTSSTRGSAAAEGSRLSNGAITLTVDENTGAITSLESRPRNVELVDSGAGLGLNDYFYVAGRDPDNPHRNGPVRITVKERGPLVASLLIESDAPGCNKLSRELRVVDGINRVDIINAIDKKNIYEQEAVHLGFVFNVPKGVMRMDTPWAVIRPEADQLPGACKNYFTVQRWVDVSNDNYGVTLATPDAPLIEVGAITSDPRGKSVGWIEHLDPTTTLYSYVMNNYWETNYKAGQEGPTTFRYSVKPHGRFGTGSAAKFGAESGRPLIPVPVDSGTPIRRSILSVEPAGVLVTAFKPGLDGKSWIVRLYNPGRQSREVRLNWAEPAPETIWLSNLAEERVSIVTETIELAAQEFVTLRASVPQK